jgi:hypothetical protein
MIRRDRIGNPAIWDREGFRAELSVDRLRGLRHIGAEQGCKKMDEVDREANDGRTFGRLIEAKIVVQAIRLEKGVAAL